MFDELGELVRTRHYALLGHARRYGCTNYADAEDVVEDVLVNVTGMLSRGWSPTGRAPAEPPGEGERGLAVPGDTDDPLARYVFKAVGNQALKSARKSSRRREIVIEHELDLSLPSEVHDRHAAVDLHDELGAANGRAIERCIDCKDHESGVCRVLSMSADGFTDLEIAEMLHLARPTVRVRRNRCRAKLRGLLKRARRADDE